MYRCINPTCRTNPSDTVSTNPDRLLCDEKIERLSTFVPRILLDCGHSVCYECSSGIIHGGASFFKCTHCGVTTTFTQSFKDVVLRSGKGSKNSIHTFNQDCSEGIHYNAFSFGKALDLGQLKATITEQIILDEGEVNVRAAHSYIDDPEVINTGNKISSIPDDLKLAVKSAIDAYKECGKAVRVLNDTRTKLNKAVHDTRGSIRAYFDWLHGLLQIEEEKMIKDLEKGYHNFICQIETKELTIVKARSSLETILKSSSLRNPHLLASSEDRKSLKNKLERYPQLSGDVNLNCNFKEFFGLVSLGGHESIKKYIGNAIAFKRNILEDYPIFAKKQDTPKRPCPDPRIGDRHKSDNSKKTRNDSLKKPHRHIPYKRSELVRLSSVNNPYDIKLRLLDSNEKYKNLVDKLSIYCSSKYLHAPSPDNLLPQTRCLVYSSNQKMWCRAVVVEVVENITRPSNSIELIFPERTENLIHVKVKLYDFGCEEKVRLSNVRENVCHFWKEEEFPRFLLNVKLAKICPSNHAETWDKKKLLDIKNKIYQYCGFGRGFDLRLLIFEEEDGQIIGDLVHLEHPMEIITPLPTLCEYLHYAKVVQNPNPTVSIYPTSHSKTYPKYNDLEFGDTALSVTVTYISTPSNFYVNLGKDVEALRTLERELQQVYSKLIKTHGAAYTFYCPKINHPCAVKFKENNSEIEEFRRGLIVSLMPPDKAKVFLVDSGRENLFHIKNCFLLIEKFMREPGKAIQCSLSDITPSQSSNWSDNAKKFFKQLLGDSSSPGTSITIKEKVDAKVVVVLKNLQLSNSYKTSSINEILIKQNFAKLSPRVTVSAPSTSNDPRVRLSAARESNSKTSSALARSEIVHSAFHILKELNNRIVKYGLKGVDALIPIEIINPYSTPDCFNIRVMTDWTEFYLSNFFERIQEKYSSSLDQDISEPFESDEICIYKCGKQWQRARVTQRIKDDQNGDQNNDSDVNRDPRVLKDRPNTKYAVVDTEFGFIRSVERKDMRKADEYFKKCEEFYINCEICGIEPKGPDGNYHKSFQKLIQDNKSRLFIRLDEFPDAKPKSLNVVLFFSVNEIQHALSAAHNKYVSIRQRLVDWNVASCSSGALSDTQDIDSQTADDYIKLTYKMSVAEHNSTVSIMKKQYFFSEIGKEKAKLIETERYPDWQPPESRNFPGIPTAYEDDLTVWFRGINAISEDGPTQYGLICQKIYQTFLEREGFLPFEHVPGTNNTCLVYSDARQRWYRGFILSIKRPKYVVQDVDTGLIDEVLLEYMSPQVVIDASRCAHHGTLHKLELFDPSDTSIRKKIKKYFDEEVLGKKCIFNWENYPHSKEMKISIHVEGRFHLKQQLLARDLIREALSKDLSPLLIDRINLLNESRLVPNKYPLIHGKDYSVEISQYIDQNYFCIQLCNINEATSEDQICIERREEKFLFMTNRVKGEAPNLSSNHQYDRGDLVVAEFESDDEYYRGIITGKRGTKNDADCYEVLFVDYGNTQLTDRSKIKKLPSCYANSEFPIHCIMVEVVNIHPLEGVWSPNVCGYIRDKISQWGDSPPKIIANFYLTSRPEQPLEVKLHETTNIGTIKPIFYELVDSHILRSD